MAEVRVSELRTATRSLLDRVAGGEELTVTVNGRPVAKLVPAGRPRWVAKSEFLAALSEGRADAGLRTDLHEIVGDMASG